MTEILHISTEAAWAAAQMAGQLTEPSLESEGFIHCSEAHQVLAPANRMYSGQSDLVLLRIDPTRLSERLLYEDSYGHGSFPHIYGPLNVDAVVGTVPFPCTADGSFELPTDLSS